MHPNPIFRGAAKEEALQLAKDTGFGILAVNGENAPLLSHVPFVIDGNRVLLHLVRSNPIARLVNHETPAKIAINGPHSYISPDWYGIDDQVPTWNYIAVHLTGRLLPLPQDELLGILDRLSDEFERRLEPKQPWISAKMDQGALAKMLRMIQPFIFEIDEIDSTYKLGQNKPDMAISGAATGVQNADIGVDVHKLSDMMRENIIKDTTQ